MVEGFKTIINSPPRRIISYPASTLVLAKYPAVPVLEGIVARLDAYPK
jgi:hypothetical protein